MHITELESLMAMLQVEIPIRCRASANLASSIPDWMRRLATRDGVLELMKRTECTIPRSVEIFYRFNMFAVWLASHKDTDVFLTDVDESKCPLVVSWYYRKHMVIFELPVSEFYGAVDLISDDHQLTWGVNLTNDPKHTHRVPFDQWLTTLAKNLVKDWRLDTSKPIMCEQCDARAFWKWFEDKREELPPE